MSKDVRPPARERSGKSPDAFRTISEVSEDIDVPQHVLRFWETKFTQIKPLKRGGGRRYYRPEDVELLCAVRDLLYEEGYTIKGVQKILRAGGGGKKAASVAAEGRSAGAAGSDGPARRAGAATGSSAGGGLTADQRQALREAIDELTALRDMLRRGPDTG